MSFPTNGISKEKIDKIYDLSHKLKIGFIEKECMDISERLLKGGFNVVFLGQFKRGKSSLINALLGREILPYGVVPVTAVVSIIRYGDNECCILKRLDGTEEEIKISDIYLYATQEMNPDNQKKVEYLDVRLPNEYLKKGLFIVDTPGISSVFESNTMVTKGFIQNIDTAVIVLGTDPPVSYDELQIIKQIRGRIKELIYVINKVDKENYENINTIKKFTTDVLKKEIGEENPTIYCLSSKDRLEGKVTFDWDKFCQKIESMLSNKSEIIALSYNNAVKRLSEQLVFEIDRYISVLKRPLDETKKQAETLVNFKKESEIFIRELGYRFQAEQDRISQLIDIEQKKFIERHKSEIEGEFEQVFNSFFQKPYQNREYYYNQMHSIAEKYVYLCIEEIKSLTEKFYSEFMNRYIEELKKLIEKIENIVDTKEFYDLLSGIDISMCAKSDFYFHHFMRYTSSSPFNFFINMFLPSNTRLKRMKDELKDYLDWLIYANCSRYNGDINQRIIESRRKIEADFKKMITDVIERTNEAINYAEVVVKEGEEKINYEINKLLEYKKEAFAVIQ